MKLNKNSGIKATIVAVAAALFAGLLALIHANPQIHAEPATTPTPQAQATPDFSNFFRNGRGGRLPQQTSPQVQPQQPATQPQPHTRTRAS